MSLTTWRLEAMEGVKASGHDALRSVERVGASMHDSLRLGMGGGLRERRLKAEGWVGASGHEVLRSGEGGRALRARHLEA